MPGDDLYHATLLVAVYRDATDKSRQGELEMSSTRLLSVIGMDQGEEDLLVAGKVAKDAGAELDAVLISCIPYPLIGGPGYGGDSPFALVWEEHKRLEKQATCLTHVLAAEGFSAAVTPLFCSSGEVSTKIVTHANSADITLLGSALVTDIHLARKIVDGVLFRSSCTLMLLPNRMTATLRPKRIVVGWNDQREAWIAVRSSMNLLRAADRVHVTIVSADSETPEDGISAGLAGFLLRHGVDAVVDHLQSSDDPALVLQQHAESIDADLIVIGAYGRSRLGERLLGGTTETMLHNCTVPVFMAR